MSTPQPPDGLEEWPSPEEEEGAEEERAEAPRTPPPPSTLLGSLPGPGSAGASPAAPPQGVDLHKAPGALPSPGSSPGASPAAAPAAALPAAPWPQPAPQPAQGGWPAGAPRQTYGQGFPAAWPQPAPPVNGMAVAGLILSFFLFPAGLALGLLSLVRIDPRTERGRGLAIAAVAIASAWIVVLSVVFPIAVMHADDEDDGHSKTAAPGSSQVHERAMAAPAPGGAHPAR
ncbi:hypothetical protein [Streptomyces hoynatensis]|uniref:DUF4190 domain-containing protein n=1 Tax=Streptomyces hoynatensis TaxID=1141874 RepID=A0A3A9Z1W4_9ACTN|nr:hypothetical protein [Streptomyces hoynatensis]RKN42283.1 hypothetical protein D7294_12595 [Streptomyces hoynatensis]